MGEIEKDRLERGGMTRRCRVGGACISPGNGDADALAWHPWRRRSRRGIQRFWRLDLTGPADASARAGEGEEDSRTQGIWWCFDLSNRAVDGAIYKEERDPRAGLFCGKVGNRNPFQTY